MLRQNLNEMLWFGDTEALVLSTPKGALIGQAIVPKGIDKMMVFCGKGKMPDTRSLIS